MCSVIEIGSTYTCRDENGKNLIIEVTGLTRPNLYHIRVFESIYISAIYDVHEETILDNIRLGLWRKEGK